MNIQQVLYNKCCIIANIVLKPNLKEKSMAISKINQVQEATLKVIADEGVNAVTIRRVAKELNRSTTDKTHYYANRDELLRESVLSVLIERRKDAEELIAQSKDPLWDFLEWSIQNVHQEIWHALLASSFAGLEKEVVQLVKDFEEWWNHALENLLQGRTKKKLSVAEATDIIGVVVEGLLLMNGRQMSSKMSPSQILRTAIEPLLK
jgi:AcrR family transcriptional regulator